LARDNIVIVLVRFQKQNHEKENSPTTACTQTTGILPVKLGYRHPKAGSDPKRIRVPPVAGEAERWALM
jgi:hypothetical protein